MTDRSVTVPLVRRPSRVHCHRPDFSFVGTPIMKPISTLSIDDPSTNSASASRWSPLRVPRTCPSVNEETFSRPLRSSTGGFGGLVHDARRTTTQQSERCPDAVFGVIYSIFARMTLPNMDQVPLIHVDRRSQARLSVPIRRNFPEPDFLGVWGHLGGFGVLIAARCQPLAVLSSAKR